MQLAWHSYRYYPYERDLAIREVSALLHPSTLAEHGNGIRLEGEINLERVCQLTYFAQYMNGARSGETLQSKLENTARAGKSRQATRYSAHGLHEYKGKFNPQVARAILNIFGIRPNSHVLDPFCGSGTTLVECAHLGAIGYGFDINPLAVFIANAKLQAISTPVDILRNMAKQLAARVNRTKIWSTRIADDPRGAYLESWFDNDVLQIIEALKEKIQDTTGPYAPIFLAIASNLLRDYSQQDPSDLRIRRRNSPLPDTPLPIAFLAACDQFFGRLADAQALIGTDLPSGRATLCDVSRLKLEEVEVRFDAAVTSPPYAMALPYIDTQRLSLVWLDLIGPDRILGLESELIGSREMRGTNRKQIANIMQSNQAHLPNEEAEFCKTLQGALTSNDGFRRKAVPTLLYRYFAAMLDSFRSVKSVVKHSGRYALIVGHNHTVLGGVRYDIDTPRHLANLAEYAGWKVDEIVPLQAYHRFSLHRSNAVEAESLILLSNRPDMPIDK